VFRWDGEKRLIEEVERRGFVYSERARRIFLFTRMVEGEDRMDKPEPDLHFKLMYSATIKNPSSYY